MSFFCHERENPTCETQCIDCEVWAALIDEKCNPTPEQKEITLQTVLRGYDALMKENKELKKIKL